MIDRTKQLIKDADAILITAGAGMGVDSGLPDFRGNEGFWKAYPVIEKLGYSFSEMANPTWFETSPKLAWAFYGHRLNLYRNTVPHKGFKMLLDLVEAKGDNYFIFTSNVDGQFQKAGFSDKKIWEVHGSIHHFQCCEKCTKNIFDAPQDTIDIDMKEFRALTIPKCPNCGNIARPNILMFGDVHWNDTRSNTQKARYNRWIKKVRNPSKNLLIIEMGAGTAIPTVRNLGDSLSKKMLNATLIRINPRESFVYLEKNISIEYGAADGLRVLCIQVL